MKHPDLFGGETEVAVPERQKTILAKWAERSGYRKAAKGAEKKCGNCLSARCFRQAHTWYKCVKLGITGSAASDIRVGHVCNFWEPETK